MWRINMSLLKKKFPNEPQYTIYAKQYDVINKYYDTFIFFTNVIQR